MGREKLFSVTLKDLQIDYFSGHGAGGQHRNKHKNCVRMYHEPSGVRVVAQNYKSRQQNLKDALKRLAKHPKFVFWVKKKAFLEEEINKWVDEMMNEKYMKIEYF